MKEIGRSKAYNQGLKAKSYNNPFERGSDEFNDFECGWSQRIKRGGSYTFTESSFSQSQPLPLAARYSADTTPKKKPAISKYDSYASAKGK